MPKDRNKDHRPVPAKSRPSRREARARFHPFAFKDVFDAAVREHHAFERLLALEDARLRNGPTGERYEQIFAHTLPNADVVVDLDALPALTAIASQQYAIATFVVLSGVEVASASARFPDTAPDRSPKSDALRRASGRLHQVVAAHEANRSSSPALLGDAAAPSPTEYELLLEILSIEREKIASGPDQYVFGKLLHDLTCTPNPDPAVQTELVAQLSRIAVANEAPLTCVLEYYIPPSLTSLDLGAGARAGMRHLGHFSEPAMAASRAMSVHLVNTVLAEMQRFKQTLSLEQESAIQPHPYEETIMKNQDAPPNRAGPREQNEAAPRRNDLTAATFRIVTREHRRATRYAEGLGQTLSAYVNEAIAEKNVRVGADPDLQAKIAARLEYQARHPETKLRRRQLPRNSGPS